MVQPEEGGRGGGTWLLSLYHPPDIPDGCRPRRLSLIVATSTFAHRLYFIWALISPGAAWAWACSEASFIQTDLSPVFLFLEEVNVITKGTKKGEVGQHNRPLLNKEKLRPRPQRKLGRNVGGESSPLRFCLQSCLLAALR